MRTDYDVIVIGAGPAGSASSYYTSKAGFSTLLIDKALFPRMKVCSGGLSPKALERLAEMGVLEEIEHKKFQKIMGVKIVSPNGIEIEGLIPSIEGYRNYGFVVPRFNLDEILRKHAIKVGTDFESIKVSELDFDGGYCRGILTSDRTRVSARAVVLATGAASELVTKENKSLESEGDKHYTTEMWYDRIEKLTDKIEIYYHEKLVPGYFWIFPESNKTANVGLGLWGKSKSARIDEILDDFPNVKKRFRFAKPISQEHKWIIPYNSIQNSKERFLGNLLVAGDALGLANPFTGEGIYYALESGKLAAESIIAKLNEDSDNGSISEDYYTACLRAFSEDHKFNDMAKRVFSDPSSIDKLIRMASSDERLRNLIIGAVINLPTKSDLLKILENKK